MHQHDRPDVAGCEAVVREIARQHDFVEFIDHAGLAPVAEGLEIAEVAAAVQDSTRKTSPCSCPAGPFDRGDAFLRLGENRVGSRALALIQLGETLAHSRTQGFLRLKHAESFREHFTLGEKPSFGDQSLHERCQLGGNVDGHGFGSVHACTFCVNAWLTSRFYLGPRLSRRFVHCRHAAEGDATALEAECLGRFRDWFVMLATTRMTKSFKMVLLRVLLDSKSGYLVGLCPTLPLCRIA